jgi:hypothetical protein
MKPHRAFIHTSFAKASLLALIVAGDVGYAAESTKVPPGDPCTVVSLPYVQKAFPGAKPGVRDRRIEKYGITECVWKDGSDVVVFGVQEFYGSDPAVDEVRSIGQSLVGGNMANVRSVRFEILKGVGLGNDAVAIVESTDAKRGIVSPGAMLALHRGERTLMLSSPALPARDRAAALKTLEALGRIAAKRLE